MAGQQWIVRTTDGGASWQVRLHDMQPLGPPDDIDCPTSDTCYLTIGDRIWATVDGGQSWTPRAYLRGIGMGPVLIECPAVDRCYVVNDTRVFVSADAGVTWSEHTLVAVAPHALSAIACGDALACVAVGSGGTTASTVNGGLTWAVHVLDSQWDYTDVSCPAANVCYATGTTRDESAGIIVATTDGAKTWSEVSPTRATLWWDLACADRLTCLALGKHTLRRTADGGRTWQPATEGGPAPQMGSVDCPTVTECYLVGIPYVDHLVWKTQDGGDTWQSDSLWEENVSSPLDLACPAAGTCFLIVDP